MQFFVILTLFFAPFSAICANQNLEIETELNFRASLFDKAAAGYENLLRESAGTEKRREWSLNLAFCFYRTENFAALPPLLEPLKPLNDQERLFLGTAYTHLGRFEDAIAILTPSQDAEIDSEITFERGITYFNWNKPLEAMNAFESVSKQSRCFSLAQVYRIKIAIQMEDYPLAQQIIDAHIDSIQLPLAYELHYLQGIVAAHTQNRTLAIESFTRSLPSTKAPWARDTLIQLGGVYLESAQDQSAPKELRAAHFDKAIEALRQADSLARTDDVTLALGNAYLAKGQNLDDNQSLDQAKNLLSNSSNFSSRDAQNQALFLSLQTTKSFEERDSIFRRLTHEKNSAHPQYGFWWLNRGINDLSQSQSAEGEMRDMLLRRAISAFNKAEHHLPSNEQSQAQIWVGRAHLLENTPAGFEKAKQIFALILTTPSNLDNIADLYYLYAQALSQGAETTSSDIEWLQRGLSKHQSERGMFQLAILHYKNEDWAQAEKLFSELVKSNDYNLRADALFWAGKSAFALDGANDRTTHYFQTLYKEYPQNPLAPEAFFSLYTYKDYLQGDREAMKHLQQLPHLFPSSIYCLNAYYLTGLDYKRDRRSSAGKKMRQRDLNGAIEAFNKVEEKFDFLFQNQLIPPDMLEYAIRLYYYASLERALANLTIADQSEGAKQEIFLEYAEGLLEKIVADFRNSTHPLAQKLLNKESFPAIQEEATYWLAKAYHKGKDIEQATETLQNMLEQFASVKVSRGYFLSRAWNELGTLYLEERDYKSALASFDKAEESGKGGILTSEDLLDLWIQKSECYRGQQDYDSAIRILTQVTHEKVVSGLRLKAMFLRSELYALQNRPELERNQLLALSKKGGEWAKKARQTLEEKYGY